MPFVIALIWGLSWPAVKISLSALPPFTLRGVVMSGAGLILLGLAAATRKSLRIPRAHWGRLLAASLLNVAIFNAIVAFSQLYTSTSRAAVLTFTMPIWAVVLARIFLDERLNRVQIAALGLGIVGLVLLGIPIVEYGAPSIGLLLPVSGALCWALGSVYQRLKPVQADRMAVTAWQVFIAGILLMIAREAAGETWPAAMPSAEALAAIGYQMFISTSIGYSLWFILLDRVGVTASSMTTLAVPVIGVLAAMPLVGDRPTPLDWLGFAIVLAAAGLALIAPKPAFARRTKRAEQTY